jgi:type II secretory pathway pseudopilin PulG
MGQQQLLLLVLATIIVGIATVVGIQAFSQNNVKSNADAMLNDAVRIASDAQAWAQKSQPFGGPNNYGEFYSTGTTAVTLSDLGYNADGPNNGYETLNGECLLDVTAAKAMTVTCTNGELKNEVKATVTGLTDDDVTGTIVRLGKAAATAPTGGGS